MRRKRERGGATVWRRERGRGWCHLEEEEGERDGAIVTGERGGAIMRR